MKSGWRGGCWPRLSSWQWRSPLRLIWNACRKKRIIAPVRAVDYDALRRIEMVDINAADARELMELPGVGETLAQRIIAYRDACGGFASVQELLNVPGIGEGKLEAMLDLVYVD